MNLCIITPAGLQSKAGNRVTAMRITRILRSLGHRVAVKNAYGGGRCDLLLALHARRSFSSIKRFAIEHPDRALVVMLTGTDVYGDIQYDEKAQESLRLASRLVVLQAEAVRELPSCFHKKTRVIYQSATPPPGLFRPIRRVFEVCVLGHLRPVKDPFRAAKAARLLPATSRIRIVHVGAALSSQMKERALAEADANPRYRWLGELPRWRALRILARSRLLVLTSRMEGGANVVSEAIAASVPVISSRIAGSIGILGPDYPGYFPVGDTEALAALMEQAENDPAFYASLKTSCARLLSLVSPDRERRSWAALLDELTPIDDPCF